MPKPNVFDAAPPAVRENMIRDFQKMAAEECGQMVSYWDAERLVRRVLRGKKSRESLYHLSSKRLCAIVPRAR